MSNKPVFGYWGSIRGFGQQTRLILQYLGVDFEEKKYNFGSGPEYKREDWLVDKPNLGLAFPNLPYWIDDQVKLTESKAIIKYIAKTRGDGALYPETPELQAVADSVEGVVNDLQRALVNLAYSGERNPETPIAEAQGEKFKQLENFFSTRQYTVGETISFVDFFVYEVLKQYVKFSGDFLKPYPALATFVEKFETLPEITECIKSSENVPCYSPWALQF